MEHLQELKQRVIADAVTRGLNPHVKMKATNIPWLKEIPEHWEMRKMKYLFDERSEKNHPRYLSIHRPDLYVVWKNQILGGFYTARAATWHSFPF